MSSLRCAVAALMFVLVACYDEAPGATASPVVYGADDRREVYEVPAGVHRTIAETAVAMELGTGLIDDSTPSNVRIDYTRTLREAQDLCPGQRFADQIEPGTCSGTLIGPRHLLTAGHCVDEARDCDGRRSWLFNFRYEAAGRLRTLTTDDVYTCARVLAYRDDGDVDHAVVELDRDVVGHTPVTIAPTLPVTPGTPLTMIGHPNGLPMKIAGGATVTTVASDGRSLDANLDAFNANSGSGVFDDSGRLVAVLTGGETDYVDAGGCNVVNVIDPAPTDDGEALVSADVAIQAFCAEPGVDAPICACDGPCVDRVAGDTCATAERLDVALGEARYDGSLTGFLDDSEGSCGGAGPDRVYALVVDQAGRLSAATDGTDTVLYLRSACDGGELACNDDIADGVFGSRIEATLSAGTYYLFVDGYDLDVDDYTLNLGLTEDSVPDASPGDDGGALDGGAMGDTGGPPSGDAAARPGDSGGCATAASPLTGAPFPGAAILFASLAFVARTRRSKG